MHNEPLTSSLPGAASNTCRGSMHVMLFFRGSMYSIVAADSCCHAQALLDTDPQTTAFNLAFAADAAYADQQGCKADGYVLPL